MSPAASTAQAPAHEAGEHLLLPDVRLPDGLVIDGSNALGEIAVLDQEVRPAVADGLANQAPDAP